MNQQIAPDVREAAASTASIAIARMPACPACGSRHWRDAHLTIDRQHPLAHCGDCGLGALAIAGGDSREFDEYWTPVNLRIYAEPAVAGELGHKYESYFKRVLAEVPNKRFLDVGSGAGISIGAAAKLGFAAMGVEPSAHAVELSRRTFNVPVTQGLLHQEDALPRDYGMLALWDVIEHVTDPEDLLRACHAHLASHGVLLLETPDESALLRRMVAFVGKSGVPFLDFRKSIYYRAHRFYFSRRAMQRLLERCGYSNIRFFAEHTMFEKEIRKKQLYGQVSAWKVPLLKLVFAVLHRLPVLANKMVVIGTKSS